MTYDITALRALFPALSSGTAHFDGPGGTQTPDSVIAAMVDYLSNCNANHGGEFTTSRESDSILSRAHQAAADLLHAPSADEIIFGANMTTLTLHLSRAIGRTKPSTHSSPSSIGSRRSRSPTTSCNAPRTSSRATTSWAANRTRTKR